MKIANISTIKNKLSHYLNFVRKGETVRIVDRHLPIADIVPIQSSKGERIDSWESILTDLEIRGVLRKGTGIVPKELLETPSSLGENPKGLGILEALLTERREGR